MVCCQLGTIAIFDTNSEMGTARGVGVKGHDLDCRDESVTSSGVTNNLQQELNSVLRKMRHRQGPYIDICNYNHVKSGRSVTYTGGCRLGSTISDLTGTQGSTKDAVRGKDELKSSPHCLLLKVNPTATSQTTDDVISHLELSGRDVTLGELVQSRHECVVDRLHATQVLDQNESAEQMDCKEPVETACVGTRGALKHGESSEENRAVENNRVKETNIRDEEIFEDISGIQSRFGGKSGCGNDIHLNGNNDRNTNKYKGMSPRERGECMFQRGKSRDEQQGCGSRYSEQVASGPSRPSTKHRHSEQRTNEERVATGPSGPSTKHRLSESSPVQGSCGFSQVIDPFQSSPMQGPSLSSRVIGPSLSSDVIGPCLSSQVIGASQSSKVIGSWSSQMTDPSRSSPVQGPSWSSQVLDYSRMGPSGSLQLIGHYASPTTKGPNGTSSTQGPNGTSSTQGPNGTSSTQGPNGTSSTQGPSGTSSKQGPNGTSSIQGPNGTSSTQGPNGTSSTQGPNGTSSTQGPSGTSSKQGPSGTSSKEGANGPNGTSSTQGPSGISSTQGPSVSLVHEQIDAVLEEACSLSLSDSADLENEVARICENMVNVDSRDDSSVTYDSCRSNASGYDSCRSNASGCDQSHASSVGESAGSEEYIYLWDGVAHLPPGRRTRFMSFGVGGATCCTGENAVYDPQDVRQHVPQCSWQSGREQGVDNRGRHLFDTAEYIKSSFGHNCSVKSDWANFVEKEEVILKSFNQLSRSKSTGVCSEHPSELLRSINGLRKSRSEPLKRTDQSSDSFCNDMDGTRRNKSVQSSIHLRSRFRPAVSSLEQMSRNRSHRSNSEQISRNRSLGSSLEQMSRHKSIGSSVEQMSRNRSSGSKTEQMRRRRSLGSSFEQMSRHRSLRSSVEQMSRNRSLGSMLEQMSLKGSLKTTVEQLWRIRPQDKQTMSSVVGVAPASSNGRRHSIYGSANVITRPVITQYGDHKCRADTSWCSDAYSPCSHRVTVPEPTSFHRRGTENRYRPSESSEFIGCRVHESTFHPHSSGLGAAPVATKQEGQLASVRRMTVSCNDMRRCRNELKHHRRSPSCAEMCYTGGATGRRGKEHLRRHRRKNNRKYRRKTAVDTSYRDGSDFPDSSAATYVNVASFCDVDEFEDSLINYVRVNNLSLLNDDIQRRYRLHLDGASGLATMAPPSSGLLRRFKCCFCCHRTTSALELSNVRSSKRNMPLLGRGQFKGILSHCFYQCPTY